MKGIAVRISEKRVMLLKVINALKCSKVNDFASVFKMKERSGASFVIRHFSPKKPINKAVMT